MTFWGHESTRPLHNEAREKGKKINSETEGLTGSNSFLALQSEIYFASVCKMVYLYYETLY